MTINNTRAGNQYNGSNTIHQLQLIILQILKDMNKTPNNPNN